MGAVALEPTRSFYAFEYDRKFVGRNIELAPLQMPLVNAGEPFIFTSLPETTYKRLPAMLADALPDDFGNALIDAWMADRGVSKDRITTLDRLAYMGKRGMGALEFRPARGPNTSSSTAIDLARLVNTARLAVQGEIDTDAALLHGCPGGGLVVLPALQNQRICRMPNKHNAKRRHHIAKMKYSVRNWREYDAALRARGSLTMWVTPDAMALWAAQPRSTPGGESFYSDLAIETSLMLRLVFRQALRQTEGLMASIFELLKVELKAPDHSTVSRRAMRLKSISKRCALPALPAGPAHILIDSTGVKVYGAGEWLQEKHGQKSRRSWRKLHLAVDADTGYIVASTVSYTHLTLPTIYSV